MTRIPHQASGMLADERARAGRVIAQAREATAQAVRRTAAGQDRNVLVAGLALRLAELGHVKDVKFRAAGSEERPWPCLRSWPRWALCRRRPRIPQIATQRGPTRRGRP